MKPEAVVLQKPMDAGQATLANGVYCGDVFKRLTPHWQGWSNSLHFSNEMGYDTPGELDVGFPGVGDRRVSTGVKAYGPVPGQNPPGVPPISDAEGRSILAVKINDDRGEAAVLIDRGPDPTNPGAQECEVAIGKFADVLTPDLIAALRSKGWIRRFR